MQTRSGVGKKKWKKKPTLQSTEFAARFFWPMPRPLRALFAASLLAAACFAIFSARSRRYQKRRFPVPDL